MTISKSDDRVRPTRPNSKVLTIAGVSTALVLGLAACGSSSPKASAPNTTTAAPASASTQAPATTTNITFGDLAPNSALTPFYAAVDQGFFKQNGLNVTVDSFHGGGATSVAALATGAVQIASGGPTNFIGDLAKGVVKGQIFGESQDSNYDLVVSKGITNISQLKGKTIGVSGINSADEIFLEATLEHYGVSPGQVTFLTAGTLAERLTALTTGHIQATADSASFRKAEEAAGTVLIKSEDNPIKVPTVTFFATQSFISAHPAALKSFIKAVVEGAQWVKDPANQAGAIAACEKGSGSTAAECSEQIAYAENPAIAGPWTWSSTYAVNQSGIQQAIQATSLVIPAASKLTVSEVVDSSIAGTQP